MLVYCEVLAHSDYPGKWPFNVLVLKVVLDVGTGSGILAIWSAQAGARKVYAVEATKMAEHARALVKANNLQDVVEVIEGPEKGFLLV